MRMLPQENMGIGKRMTSLYSLHAHIGLTGLFQVEEQKGWYGHLEHYAVLL